MQEWETASSVFRGAGLREAARRLRRSDFARKVAETYAARFLMLGLGFATSILVTRTLGPEGRGWFAAASALSAVGVQFGNLGLHASNTYHVARDRSLLPFLVGNSLAVGAVVGTLMALAGGLGERFFPWSPVQGALLFLVLASIPIGLTVQFLQNLLIGLEEIRASNRIDVGTGLASVGLLVVLALGGWTTPETVFAVGLAVSAGALGWCGWTLWRRFAVVPRWSPSLLKAGFRYGFKAYAAALFSFLVLKSDVLMIQYLRGAREVGYYSVAVTLADILYVLPVVVGNLLFPRLSSIRDEDRKRLLAARASAAVAAVMVAACGAAFLLADLLVPWVYGGEFAPAVPAFRILCGAVFVLSVNTIWMNYFASIGLPWIAVFSPFAALVLNVGLNFLWIPRWGFVAAAWSSLACYALMGAFTLAYVAAWRKKHG